jgi:hypothetical protein
MQEVSVETLAELRKKIMKVSICRFAAANLNLVLSALTQKSWSHVVHVQWGIQGEV